MGNVLEFTGAQVRRTQNPEDNGFLIGYAAAIADVRRHGSFAVAELALQSTGFDLCDFEAVNVDEDDMDELEAIYEEM